MIVEIETFDEFAARHGGAIVAEEGTETYLLPSGATTDASDRLRREPPADPTQRLKAQHRYWTARLRADESAFGNAKAEFVNQAYWHSTNPDNCPPAPPNAAEILKGLRKAATESRAELRKIERQLAETPEAMQRRKRESFRQQRAADGNRTANELRSIDL